MSRTSPASRSGVVSDIVICGLGPAGRALAHRCLVRGMAVTVVDPNPCRRWTATYAAWADELPDWLDPAVTATTMPEPTAHGRRPHRIPRPYTVFDTRLLQESLDITGAELVTDRATALDRHTVTLASGAVLRGDRIIDARGLPRAPNRAEQTAYGLVLDHAEETLFMDWRPDNGADPTDPPSFLYAIPLGDGTTLFEETCLVGLPAPSPAALAQRLHHRLRARGISVRGDERVERVRFPVTGGRPSRSRFGAAGAFLHPATGYSVAAALSAADTVAAGRSAWPPTARAVHRLRLAGLRALLALPPSEIPVFFDGFFDLPLPAQRAYLSGRTELTGTLTAMTRLFTALPAPTRTRLVTATLALPFPARSGHSA
ncbi:lycopene cyclase family protein [Nocardia paucivorans]|uniref:lycopene cyclase family protein n=1 Tax=Nocardia paucivorans TaxID=114259 RepID=UPI000687FC84|nr:lycopene cyclase family protein [Nocardia paucivorans]